MREEVARERDEVVTWCELRVSARLLSPPPRASFVATSSSENVDRNKKRHEIDTSGNSNNSLLSRAFAISDAMSRVATLACVCALGSSASALRRPSVADRRVSLLKLSKLSGGAAAASSIEELPPTTLQFSASDDGVDEAKIVAADDDASFAEKLAGELVGTFLLTLAVACASAQNLPMPSAPLAVAAVLIGLIYSFGPLSGAIFNPAVSVALCMRGRMSIKKALAYAGVETLGAALAGLAGTYMYGRSIAPAIADASSAAGWRKAAMAEVLFTGTIVQAVLHCGTSEAQEGNPVIGLAIGLTVFGCSVCSAVSGSCFNPALGVGMWIAKAIAKDGFSWALCALYCGAPSLGAALSTLVFWAARPREP